MTRRRTDDRARAWVEVDLGALQRNARALARHVAPARLLPMVKADGYGLGSVEVAGALRALEPWAFGVATPAEGAGLRAAGLGERIIVFSPWAAGDVARLLEHGMDAAVLSLASLRVLRAEVASAGGTLDVHLEVDTGMGRAGLPAGEADAWAGEVARIVAGGPLRLASAYTHFHSAERPGPTRDQLGRFDAALAALGAAGVRVPLRHAGNSAAVLRAAQYHLDLVRPGIYLYGGRRGASIPGPTPDPEPVARVRARVLEVRELAPGSTVSYGARYTTDGRERVATLGIGYADGVPWRLSNRGSALVDGIRVPIRGAVCMDLTVVDVSSVPGVEPGTVVTLLGRDGDEEIALEEVAGLAGTIGYEVLTTLGRRLPRVYSGET